MDEIIRAVTGDGYVKISCITARGIVERARQIHGLAPTAAAALGRTLCAASMLGELMKEEDASLTIRVNGGGPIGSVIAVADSDGCVRGYVDEPQIDLPLRGDGKLDVGGGRRYGRHAHRQPRYRAQGAVRGLGGARFRGDSRGPGAVHGGERADTRGRGLGRAGGHRPQHQSRRRLHRAADARRAGGAHHQARGQHLHDGPADDHPL